MRAHSLFCEVFSRQPWAGLSSLELGFRDPGGNEGWENGRNHSLEANPSMLC